MPCQEHSDVITQAARAAYADYLHLNSFHDFGGDPEGVLRWRVASGKGPDCATAGDEGERIHRKRNRVAARLDPAPVKRVSEVFQADLTTDRSFRQGPELLRYAPEKRLGS